MPVEPFSLSIVIPVHNDAIGLKRLLDSLAPLGLELQLVIVDDSSIPPVRASFPADNALPDVTTTWLRCEPLAGGAGQGAGVARNLGQRAATGSHVLFLDADDTVFPALGTLVRSLEGRDFDFVLFAHTDSRRIAQGLDGPDEAFDRAIWEDVAPGVDARPLRADEAHSLCRISNYPWNKIWRRGFLDEAQIRCTEIPMHNDIEPHWAGFLSARRILVSGHACVLHSVTSGGGQLTNRRDAARLRLFEALDAVLIRFTQEAARNPDSATFIGPFLDFVLRLCDWVESITVGPDAAQELRRHRVELLTAVAALPDPVADAVERALEDEPALAARFLEALDPA